MNMITPGGRGLGWRPSLPDQRNYRYAPDPHLVAALPASVDLRPHMPAIRDQGQLGSCTAFAATTLAHFTYMKDGWHNPFDASPLYQYWWERYQWNATGVDTGSDSITAMKTLAIYGMTAEHNWPYDIARFTEEPPTAANANAVKHKAMSYYQLQQTLLTMKACLAEGWPWLFGCTVYESFEGDQALTTGLVPMPAVGEPMLGGHELVACGYDDARQVFIVHNSWGVGFGDHGYLYFPYAYLTSTLAGDLFTLRVQH